MKRWMAAAALGVAAAGGLAAPGSAQASSTAWYQVYQADVSGSFSQIAAVSPSNIWAVGRTYTGAGKTIYRPFVRHFNGSSWQAITIPRSSGSTADWVSASGAGNVWIGGFNSRRVATSVVYRWNGSRWAKIPVPRFTILAGVLVLAPHNVWAYGWSGTVAGEVFHWNGTKWKGYLRTARNFVPQSISASAPGNVWVSGYALVRGKQRVAAYKWTGTDWNWVRMPHPVFDYAPNVTAVSRSNVWIGWYGYTSSRALHWDGYRWHNVTTPDFADPLDIVPDGKGGYWFGARAILTGDTWTTEQIPGFTGSFGGLTRIGRTASFLLSAGVETGGSSAENPTIFRFDL